MAIITFWSEDRQSNKSDNISYNISSTDGNRKKSKDFDC